MQDVANEILLKHLNQEENPHTITFGLNNISPDDLVEEHDKVQFQLTLQFKETDQLNLTISYTTHLQIWNQDGLESQQQEPVDAQHNTVINISEFSTKTGYIDQSPSETSPKWEEYYLSIWKQNLNIICKIKEFIVASLFQHDQNKPHLCGSYEDYDCVDDIYLTINSEDKNYEHPLQESKVCYDDQWNLLENEKNTPRFENALSERICKVKKKKKNGWCDPPLCGNLISDKIAYGNIHPMGCVADYLERNSDNTNRYTNTRMIHTYSSTGFNTILLKYVVGAMNKDNQLIIRVTNDDVTELCLIASLNVTNSSVNDLQKFLVNFIDYDTIDTVYRLNWFLDDFDSSDPSQMIIQTPPNPNNPVTHNDTYLPKDCSNTFRRLRDLIQLLSDRFVETGFIPDDTKEAFQECLEMVP